MLKNFYYDWVHPLVTQSSKNSIPIHQSVKMRLEDLEYHFNKTQQEYQIAMASHDAVRRETSNKETILKACEEEVDNKLNEIRRSMLHFCDQVAEIKDDQESDIIEMMNKLVNCISKLKKPNELDNIYEWLDPNEYWSLSDYREAINRRDQAQVDFEKSKNNERPYTFRLEEVKEQMEAIKSEKETLTSFTSKYKEECVDLTPIEPPPPYEDDKQDIITTVSNFIAPTFGAVAPVPTLKVNAYGLKPSTPS